MRAFPIVAASLPLLFFLGAASSVRSEDAKSKEKSLVELCQQYQLKALSGKVLAPEEMAVYTQCARIAPSLPSYIDPQTGQINTIVQNPPSTYRDADGCLRNRTTNIIIECRM